MPDAMMSYDAPGSDERIFAEFQTKAVVDQARSKEAGYPVFHDVVFVRIIQPGDSRLNEYNQPARPQDIERFPRQYAAFQRGQKQEVDGAPLSLLFPSEPAIVENFRRAGVFVVEQLANLSDTGIQELGLGGRIYKEKAKAWLAQAEKGKDFHTLSDRLDKMELSNREKDDKIQALTAALAEAQAKSDDQPRRGPGRPSNAELAAREARKEIA